MGEGGGGGGRKSRKPKFPKPENNLMGGGTDPGIELKNPKGKPKATIQTTLV